MDARTPPQEIDRVEYRGDAKHVVVLPKATVKLMEFDVDGPDRIRWASQNCVLVHVSGSSEASGGGAPPKAAGTPPAATASVKSGSMGVLTLAVDTASASDKVGGRKLWVLKADPQFALIRGGVTSTPYGTPLQNWMRACYKREHACEQGVVALKPYTVGIATTDATGHAQTPPLPSGRYWVMSDAKVDDKRVMWNQPVDVKGTDASVMLDRRNAMPME
jgi:hypothetical protein